MPKRSYLAFERNPPKTLAMIKASLRCSGSMVPGARQNQLSQGVEERRAADQMKRLGDWVIAGVFLMITTLDASRRSGDQIGKPGSRLGQAQLHRMRRAAF